MEASDASAIASFAGNNQQERINNNLLLLPGETSEMLIELENLSDRPITWRLEITGEYPQNWCNWQQETALEIPPLSKQDESLYFQIPADFFENQFALNQRRSRLQLNYEAQISIYTETNNQRQLIAYRVFNLCVRPNTTYLNFLPTIYREIDFVGRFIGIFEQAFDPVLQIQKVLWSYLDPLTAPEAMLPFLAQWVAWPIDNHWDIQQQRRLIRNAIELYRWHGTRFGLRFYLHLYTGLPLDEHLPEVEKHIGIEEIFSGGFILGKTTIGVDSMLGGGCPFHFIITLRPDPDQEIDEQIVREIIDQQKPAFCTYDLDIVHS